ncbi:RNA helicase [Desulfuribacillus stibiiarsenatis]|uniref:ATP-dependent RNA helicase CshA n=1 Tax=Desulfuribacillus stibiiarsenatis TaxID=1390249 RepID=A0A1E5L758_9FIRM|nr:RNA helicase [Desulfuribacillus stibiiarsenatis]
MGFEEPTPIQEECVPIVLQGHDVIGQAQTGTGKTAAFGIPLIQKVEENNKNVQALVLTPTRELAIQVAGELRKIGKLKQIKPLPIYGGQHITHQIRALNQGAQIVIGTPGRILDHLRRKTLKLDAVKTIILDEADEMLDMGFVDDIESIVSSAPRERQTLLFSATMPYEIKKLSTRYMKSPKNIAIAKGDVSVPLIQQFYYKVLERDKFDSFCRILDQEEIGLGIVFCRTKKGVDELTDSLQDRGYLAEGLHGDLSQPQRDKVMQKFREASIELLIATDVAARGIDVENVSHVFNYDIPQDPESYVHRVGRTGRAGKKGIAITLVTPREIKQLVAIQKQTKVNLNVKDVPSLEEVAKRMKEQWKDKVTEAVESSQLLEYETALQDLFAKYGAESVAAAAMKIAVDTSFAKQDVHTYDFGDTGSAKGMVRFFINVGKNGEFTPKIVMDILQEHAGIASSTIGKINIFDRFTFVEVAEAQAPFVYEAFQNTRVNGKRINVEPAKPRV